MNKLNNKPTSNIEGKGFDKLKHHLFYTVFLIPMCFLIVVSIASELTSFFLYYNSFLSIFSSDISMLSSRFEIAYSQISAKALSTGKSTSFIKALKEDDESSLSSSIQSLSNSDSDFLGTIFYSEDRVITSYSVSGVPTYNQITALDGIKNFLSDSNISSYVNIRTECIPTSFNSYPYNNSKGLLSIFSKVIDSSGVLLGFIETDLVTDEFFDNYLSLEQASYMDNYSLLLISGDTILKRPSNAKDQAYASKLEYLDSAKKNGDVYYAKKKVNPISLENYSGDISIYLEVPIQNFDSKVWILTCSIIGVDLILGLLFFFIARKYALSNVKRLTALQDSMDKDINQLPINKEGS